AGGARDRARLLVHQALHRGLPPRARAGGAPGSPPRPAPGAAPRPPPPPRVLGLAVLVGGGGFDPLYACQDVEFDRLEGLRSLPAAVGVPRALRLARLMHAGTVLLLLSLFALAPLHPVYLAGVAVVAVILAWEHSLVAPQ